MGKSSKSVENKTNKKFGERVEFEQNPDTANSYNLKNYVYCSSPETEKS